jgi:splicing factor 3B subunit 2
MERVLKFRDNQHEEDRVTKLHSGGHQTDSGIDQNDEYDDESDEETTPENGLSRKAKKEIEKRRRRRAKKKTKSTAPPPPHPPSSDHPRKETNKIDEKKKKKRYSSDDEDDNSNVEIEYVQEDIPIKRGDGYYSHFVKVFENFKLDQNGDDNNEYYYNKYGKKVLGPKILLPRDKTNIDENDDDEDDDKEINNYDKKKKDLDNDEENKKKSKKQLKRETRLTVAQLKQLVIRPDVVEMFDVTAKDPKLLVHLKVNISFLINISKIIFSFFVKATRNTVPVPRHWCAKRKYLQGKRGIEKPPFQLPDFIRRTGIMEMREALQEKEQNKTLKQKMREKVRPKLGKIDIDYQKLHDAFFRWQTKPRMSIHGDLYYEGKENETRLKDKKPGILSEELRVALGIPVGPTADKYPPPWLIAMQRYGPPPSYPNLKIAGLNAPIPEGCQFGYHSGGWGKPPVDEHGRPLYGDVFGTNQFAYIRNMAEEEHVDKSYWGEIEEEEQEQEAVSSSDEEETTEDTGLDGESTTEGQMAPPTATEHVQHHVHHHHHPASEQEQNIHAAGFQTPHGSEGFVTPSGKLIAFVFLRNFHRHFFYRYTIINTWYRNTTTGKSLFR